MEEKCATLFHELGHYYAGHFQNHDQDKKVTKRGNEINSLFVREFEAETICWLLCERCGIDNPSAAYLHDYLGSNKVIPEQISMDAILKASGRIEGMM